MKKWRKWMVVLVGLVLVNAGLFIASRIPQSEPETPIVVPQKGEQAEPQKTSVPAKNRNIAVIKFAGVSFQVDTSKPSHLVKTNQNQ